MAQGVLNMSTKKFTRKTFVFLHQINHDPRCCPVDVCVALELTQYFNEKIENGRAWPGYKTIGDAIGVHETTVLRSIHRLEATGHIRVEWGCQGKGNSNRYWMIIQPAEKARKGAPTHLSKPAPTQVSKPAPMQPKPAPVQENLLKNLLRAPPEPQRRREREDALTR